jgi:hypothetical protein
MYDAYSIFNKNIEVGTTCCELIQNPRQRQRVGTQIVGLYNRRCGVLSRKLRTEPSNRGVYLSVLSLYFMKYKHDDTNMIYIHVVKLYKNDIRQGRNI